LEIQILKVKQWSMDERVKEIEKTMQEHENKLTSQKGVVERAQEIHYQDRKVLWMWHISE
jgi:hypothetical protein